MSCIEKLTQNITYGCNTSYPAQGGLDGGFAVLINRADIDVTSLTRSGATITNLSLKSGATGYEISFVKQLSNTGNEFTVNDGLDTFTHSFIGRVYGQGATDAERIYELSKGEFVCVVETKWKGAGAADAFKVYGINNGLKMAEGSQTTLENDGSFLFTLSSVENFGEQYPYNVYLETDYTTTKTKVDNLFS
jgi:hypothetical protein